MLKCIKLCVQTKVHHDNRPSSSEKKNTGYLSGACGCCSVQSLLDKDVVVDVGLVLHYVLLFRVVSRFQDVHTLLPQGLTFKLFLVGFPIKNE